MLHVFPNCTTTFQNMTTATLELLGGPGSGPVQALTVNLGWEHVKRLPSWGKGCSG